MKKRTAWVLAACVLAVTLGAAAIGALALLMRGGAGGPRLSGSSYLALDLAGPIPEDAPTDLGNFLERRPPTLRTLVESIDRAAADSDVKGLVVRVSSLP
jgi:hypothetical protein